MKKVTRLIIIITSVSLVGIILTQGYWVKKAINLREDQFTTSVRISLKSVNNKLLNIFDLTQNQNFSPDSLPTDVIYKVREIEPKLLSSMIYEEFDCMQISDEYAYAVVDIYNNLFIVGDYEKYQDGLLNSEHKIPLIGFQHADQYWLVVYFPTQQKIVWMQMLTWLILSAIFILILIISSYYSNAFFMKQKKLSEMKSDFVNNMTHEFKTPIATISLASEMLMNKNIYNDPLKTKLYATVIHDENIRLESQVEQVLKISLLDRKEVRIRKKELDLHKVIAKTVGNFNLIVKKRDGSIVSFLYAKNAIINADRAHIINVISNLLDNANKYSPEAPEICITTRNIGEGILLSIEDEGIGISKENQKNIFKKLYRIHTGDIHDIKGFGLGLYYVKTIVELHSGIIKCFSELGKGSKFDVYLPFNSNEVTAEEDETDQTIDFTG